MGWTGKHWGAPSSCLSPYHSGSEASWDVISLQTQAENSMPQAEPRLSTALLLVCSDRHTASSVPTMQSPNAYVAQPPLEVPSWKQGGNAFPQAQSQAVHSANPPGPQSKQNGTRPRVSSRNWRCKQRAAAAAQLAVISASNKGVTWAVFSLTPRGLRAQTPLLTPSASPGKPVTWQTQVPPFTEDQDFPAAHLAALRCSQLSPHHAPLCSMWLCSQPSH